MKPYQKILVYGLFFVAGAAVMFAIVKAASASAASNRKGANLPETFDQMVAEARAEVPSIKPADAYQMTQKDPNTLIVDVRDAADIPVTGLIKGAINVSLGTLTYKADHQVPPEWHDQNFQDFARPIITTCETGEMAALAGKLLKDMGYTNVHILEGATAAWKEAGYPVVQP